MSAARHCWFALRPHAWRWKHGGTRWLYGAVYDRSHLVCARCHRWRGDIHDQFVGDA